MDNLYFIEYEGFQYGDGATIMKEFCVLNFDTPQHPLYFNFIAPTPWENLSEEEQRGFKYQTSRLHHLQWYEGATRYCNNCTWYHLTHAFPNWAEGTFFVMDKTKGSKIKFLQDEFPQLNLIAYDAVAFRNLPLLAEYERCPYRDHGNHCAFRKCIQLHHHYSQN